MQPEDELDFKWTTEEIRKPHESFYHKYWKKIFIASCLCALLVDPLFLYIPILKDDIKCLMLDPKLKIRILILRSVTDFFYLMDSIIRLYRSENYSCLVNELNGRQQWMSFVWKSIWALSDILIDIVAVLPLPQVAILIFFSKMSDLRSLTTTRMVIMNVFALLQYVPRVLRIYLSFNELKRTLKEEITETPLWIKGVLNFTMYIIASHVFGAVWYFFAIQRMMICWHSACRKDDGCDRRIFSCHDHHAFRNTTSLNDLCSVSVDPSNTMLFDFGIFATVLQSGIVGSTNYFQKFLKCFWWGLQNLSSLGSNLATSVDGWENLFTVFISIIGLLMFLYLIGNLQMYMQFETSRTENRKHEMLMKHKRKEKSREIDLLLFKNGIRTGKIKDMKLLIMEKVQPGLEAYMDTKWDNVIPLLPLEIQSDLRESLSMTMLKEVLRGIDGVVLKKLHQELEPVRYTENDHNIIQKGEPLENMLIIVDGHVSIENRQRGARGLCGEELLRWPFSTYFPHKKPLATESVKPVGVVEALALKACVLEKIYNQKEPVTNEAQRHRRLMKEEMGQHIDGLMPKNGIPKRLNEGIKLRILEDQFQEGKVVYWDNVYIDWYNLVSLLPSQLQDEIKSYMPLTKLKEVQMLQGMDEVVLKKLLQQLEPVMYDSENDPDIIQKGEPLEKMLFIVDGHVSIENRQRGAGGLCGEELLRWPFSTSFPHTKPLATESIKAVGVVEALALKACVLENTYNQPEIATKEGQRHKRMMKEEMGQHIDGLMSKNGIPKRLIKDIKSWIVEDQFQEGKVVCWDKLYIDWYNLVSLLPSQLQNDIKSYLTLTELKKMRAFQNMKESVLKEICRHLQPMKYSKNVGHIIKRGDPVQMLYILDGTIAHEGCKKDAGELYGEKLLVWPFSISFPDPVPTAAESLFAETDVVEALVLTASDMKSVATEFRKHFIKNYGRLSKNLVNYVIPVGTTPASSSSESVVKFFTEEELKEVTRNTCDNYVNEGGYETVYEATLNGRRVAIKACNSTTGDQYIQSQRLVQEAFVLSQIRHKNVVRLLGCCLEAKWPLMVYERNYSSTLWDHIHIKEPKLSLESRLNIAAETARALAYLHFRSVIHRDVKTANILIDDTTYTARVSGFEASRLLHEDEMEDEASTLPGTSGYLDPEYLESNVLTEKSDVYSFGVVLVELLTCQHAISSDRPERSLANVFVRSVQEGRLDQILDGNVIKDKFTSETAKEVSELAMRCLRAERKERPSMEEVAEELEGLANYYTVESKTEA